MLHVQNVRSTCANPARVMKYLLHPREPKMKSYLIEEVVKATAQQHPRQTDSDLWGLQLEQTFVSTVSAAEHG